MKRPTWDSRAHHAHGIFYGGYLYESVPALGLESRLFILEVHPEYLVVSAYSRPPGSTPCKPIGEPYRVNRIGLGKPTKERIERLKDALKEMQDAFNAAKD